MAINNIDDNDFEQDKYYGIMPPDGAFVDSGNKYYLQKRPTVGGWTEGSEGFVQQTFLGASVTDFNISAGFNDNSSKLSVSLVVDEYNESDKLPIGSGDDIYHNGQYDSFNPPPIGAPVFFKFGKNHASTVQAYLKSYEIIYKQPLLEKSSENFPLTSRKEMDSLTSGEEPRAIKDNHFLPIKDPTGKEDSLQRPSLGYSHGSSQSPITPPVAEPNTIFEDKSEFYDPASIGKDPEAMTGLTSKRGEQHLVFGGILESYSESKTLNGNPLFKATVTDPKEILKSCTLILNDYGETTFNNKNLFNIYGFLEYDPSKEFKKAIYSKIETGSNGEETSNVVKTNLLTKHDTIQEDPDDFNKYINLEDCYWMRSKVDDPNLRDFFNAVENEEGTEEEPPTQLESMRIGEIVRKNIREKSKILKDSNVKQWFPITGYGMSRRTDKGMPLYRIVQSLGFMNYFMPQEYKDNGFGGPIDFRGYKFALNIEGLNDLFLDESLLETIYDSFVDREIQQRKECPAKTVADAMKDIYIESDDLTMLDLIQQIAELFNKDFVVELLPPIDAKYLDRYPLTEEDNIYAIKEISDYNEKIIEFIQTKKFKTGVDKENNTIVLDGTGFYPNRPYTENDLITGIISVTFIDKNKQPSFDEMAKFISKYQYEAADIGFDLVNETTDKFLVGAQRVDLYFFSSYKDRDERLQILSNNPEGQDEDEKVSFKGKVDGEIKRLEKEKWTFTEALKQQILPYYGELSPGVASIPLGDGPFQQILINTQSLNAFGVGEYYLATELELRAAMVSFEQWSEFILKYSRRYVEGFIAKDKELTDFPAPSPADLSFIKKQVSGVLFEDSVIDLETEQEIDAMRCGVSVPRSVFVSNENYYASSKIEGEDDVESPSDLPEETEQPSIKLPASPCFPPYGYPLYYGRAEAIGVLRPSDVSKLANNSEVLQIIANDFIENNKKALNNKGITNYEDLFLSKQNCNEYAKRFAEEKRLDFLRTQPITNDIDEQVAIDEKANKVFEAFKKSLTAICESSSNQFIAEKFIESNGNFLGFVNTVMKVNLENAKRVHRFIQAIANEHLGKSFLVKIPQKTNIDYETEVKTNNAPPDNGMVVNAGPFGFKPIYQSGKVIPTGEELLKDFNQNFVFTEHKRDSAAIEKHIQYNSYILDNVKNGENFTESSEDIGLTQVTGIIDLLTIKEFAYDPKFPATGVSDAKGKAEEHQTDKEKEYLYKEGALRPRYNPINNKWDFNYTPQDKGGYHSDSVDEQKALENCLYPIDPKKIITDSNRISPYVIYNNSQLLHFKGGNADSIIQERLVESKFKGGAGDPSRRIRRMDLCTILDNVGTEEAQLENPLNSYSEEPAGKFDPNKKYLDEHVAFVKATTEEKLYFAPRFSEYVQLPVSSDSFQLLKSDPASLDFITQDVIEGDDIDAVPSGSKLLQTNFVNNVFGPKDSDISPVHNIISLEYTNVKKCIKGDINEPQQDIDGEKNPNRPVERKTSYSALISEATPSMNSAHVYALVKLSTRPVSNIDRRFADGPNKSTNPVTVAKIWNRDTIKNGGPWQQSLAKPKALTRGIEEEKIKFLSAIETAKDRTEISEVLPFANPELLIDFVHPSPVIPDTIALPLMSKERCYGPWRSNANIANREKDACNETYMNIGGKVEYVKDENLSPWKFDGTGNMNKAGEIQVSFSNNLLLFTEKGSFTVPDIVPDIYIGRPLSQNTPLIDSISLSVDGNGIKTSVSMEMFSAKYGKTEKQRQEQLSRLTREEKLRRQNQNRLIRADAERPNQAQDLKILIDNVGQADLPLAQDFTGLQTKQTVYDSVVASVVPQKVESYVLDPQGSQPVSGVTVTKTSNNASFQHKGYLQEAQSKFTNINDLNNALQRTGGSILNDIYFPFDESVYNPYMTNMPYVDNDSIIRRTS